MRPFDIHYIFTAMCALLPYIWVTVYITAASFFIGLVLGVLLAWARLGKNRICRIIATGYVYIIRCTPSIVLLFIVFYGIPKLVSFISGAPYFYGGKSAYVIICLSLISAASICEIVRGAYLALDSNLWDSALCLGFTKAKAVFYVMAPQLAILALPNAVNSAANLIKQGALAYTIGLIDLMGQSQLIIARNFGAYGLETYLALSVIFWGLTFCIEFAANLLEKRFFHSKGASL